MTKPKCEMNRVKSGGKRYTKCKNVAAYEIELTGGQRILVCRQHRGNGRLIRAL